MKIKVEHPFEPELAMIRNPLTFSGTPIKDYKAPPLLGADTKEVLATIGYDDAKVEAVKKQKIVGGDRLPAAQRPPSLSPSFPRAGAPACRRASPPRRPHR